MHTIVGIDTGKTAAFACLDLSGRLVRAAHRRNAGIAWLVASIRSAGTPVIIASDKADTKSSVIKKVGSAFSTQIYYPDRNIPLAAKKRVAKSFGLRNPHERDACIAALKAFNMHSNKLKQAERKAAGMGPSVQEAIKAKVIMKYSMNEAINGIKANRR